MGRWVGGSVGRWVGGPYIIETMHSYTLPIYSCNAGLHLSVLKGGTAVCGHS